MSTDVLVADHRNDSKRRPTLKREWIRWHMYSSFVGTCRRATRVRRPGTLTFLACMSVWIRPLEKPCLSLRMRISLRLGLAVMPSFFHRAVSNSCENTMSRMSLNTCFALENLRQLGAVFCLTRLNAERLYRQPPSPQFFFLLCAVTRPHAQL